MSKASKQAVKNKTNPSFVQNIVQDFEMEVTVDWALEFLKRTYVTRTKFVDNVKLKEYRDIDKGIIDETKLKKFFDPKDVNSHEGGNAEYMRTDWKPCPLIQSLINIIKKQIKKHVSDITVKGTDKVSIDKKAAEKLRIQNKKNMVDNINQVLAITGQPPISYDTDLDKLFKSYESKKEDAESQTDEAPSIISQIRAQASDDNDYTMLAESGMLKDGVEIAHEEMIDHYREHSKFDDLVLEKIISDYMKIQASCFRFYTSEVNGLPEVLYMDLNTLYTSYFQHKDASDMDYWGHEFICTWSNYMKLVGGGLTIEENKAVYEMARLTWGTGANFPDFDANIQQPTFGYLNTSIRLGYIEIRKHKKDENTGKYYDVIKKFYYLPLAQQSLDKKYIMGLGDLQDMYRHGTNLAKADFSIILRRDNTKMSFYDIMNVDFYKMNLVYNQYLNTFASFIPEGVVFSTEQLVELANEIIADMQQESENEMEQASQQKIIQGIVRRFKQSGTGMLPKRKGDNAEERFDSPTSIIENKILIDCAGLINQLMTIYNLMLMSLGINPNRLAQEPKPRTTNKSISGASANSQFATMELEEDVQFSIKEFAKRMMYYNQQVITEFDKNLHPISDRAKEMYAIVGTKGVNWLEVYRDMPEQRCVIEVESEATDEDWIMLLNYVNQQEALGTLDAGTLPYIKSISNFKLASLYTIMSIKRTKQNRIENQQSLMAQQQAAVQQQQQAQAQANSQAMQQQATIQERLTTLENQLRTEGQIAVKKQTLENKLQEEDHKLAVKTTEKQQESFA